MAEDHNTSAVPEPAATSGDEAAEMLVE